jgi:hypothetical protein
MHPSNLEELDTEPLAQIELKLSGKKVGHCIFRIVVVNQHLNLMKCVWPKSSVQNTCVLSMSF